MPPLKLIDRIFTRLVDPTKLAPAMPGGPVPAGQLELTWLGTAGVALELDGQRLLVDPYFSRPGPGRTIARPLIPDEQAIRRHAPTGINYIICSHSHHDHILDVPTLARRDGAHVVGSRSSCNYCRGAGVPEAQITEVKPPESMQLGPFGVTLLPSRHSDPPIGIPKARGRIPSGVKPPMGGMGFRNDQTVALKVEVKLARGSEPLSLMYLGSASFLPETLMGQRCDLLVVAMVGHHRTPGFTARVLANLRPRVVIPIHFDNFLLPLERGLTLLRAAKLNTFLREVEQADTECEAVVLDLMGRYRLTGTS